MEADSSVNDRNVVRIRARGSRTQIAKFDVESAYNVPVHLEDRSLLEMSWKEKVCHLG